MFLLRVVLRMFRDCGAPVVVVVVVVVVCDPVLRTD
jgi:hypothetical protein